MTNIGLNLNTNNMLGLMQMFGGNGLGTSILGLNSIFSCIRNNKIPNVTGSLVGTLATGVVLNYAPQILGKFIGGISSAVQTSRAQKAEESEYSQLTYDSENMINQVLSTVGLENSEALKRDLISKHKNMLIIAKQNGEKLDLEEVQTRLTNYAKGWKFNQFQVKSALGLDTPEFETDCSKAKDMNELKKAYNQFAKEYIEFYDQDGNESISVYEMYYQELVEHYTLKKNIPTIEAKMKALEIVNDYKNKGYGINAENGAIYPLDETEEADLFLLTLGKLLRTENTLEFNFDGEFNTDEIAVYLNAMASIKDQGNNITSGDAIQMGFAEVDADSTTYKNILASAKNFLYSE